MAEVAPILVWSCALDGERALVSLRGELDIAAASPLREARVAAGPARMVVIDLEDVSFMDGGGLDALKQFRHEVAGVGAEVRFGPPPRAVARYLDLTGADLG